MSDRTMREEPHFLRRILLVSSGLIVWTAHFTAIYAFNTLACTRAFAAVHVMGFGLVPVVVVALTLGALAATGAILVLSLRDHDGGAGIDGGGERGFLRYMTVAVAALSLIAIAWNGLPALLVSPCA